MDVKQQIRKYLQDLKEKKLSTIDMEEKIESTKVILQWAKEKNHITAEELYDFVDELESIENKVKPAEPKKKPGNTTSFHVPAISVKNHDDRHIKLPVKQFIYMIPILFVVLLIAGIYIGKGVTTQTPVVIEKTEATIEGKTLRFQGKLRDDNGDPITEKTDVIFRLYNSPRNGSPVYEGPCVGSKGLTPDMQGTFDIAIGMDCEMDPIPDSILSSTEKVYLAIKVGKEKEMTPRYPIANVAYASTSDSVKGMTLGVQESSIPYIDDKGGLTIGAASPVIRSTQGDFTIEGQTLTLRTPTDSEGSIFIEPADGGNTIIQTGDVGIGVEVPQTKLDVAGSISVSEDIFLNGEASAIYQEQGKPIHFYSSSEIDDLTSPAFTINGEETGGVEVGGNIALNGKLMFQGKSVGIVGTDKSDIFLGDKNTGNVLIQAGKKIAIGTTQTVDMITLGGSVSPDKNEKWNLGSATNKWDTTYTSELVLGKEGIGGFWQRKEGFVAPTSQQDDLILGSTTINTATVKLSGKTDSPSWIKTGLLGVGTTSPHYTFSALGLSPNNAAVSLSNLTTADNSATSVLRLQLGTSPSGTNSKFVEFYAGASDDNNGRRVGSITINNNGVSYTTGNADFAEYMTIAGDPKPGELVAITSEGVVKATDETNNLVGIISDSAGFVGNTGEEGKPNAELVGLVGQIETMVSTTNGTPKTGDFIGASAIPGIGSKVSTDISRIGYVIATNEQINKSLNVENCPVELQKGSKDIRCGRIKVLISIDNVNNTLVKKTNESSYSNSQIKGTAHFPKGKDTITIQVPALTEESFIFITPVSSEPVQFTVSKQNVCNKSEPECINSFHVVSSRKLDKEAKINWMISNDSL